MILTVQGLDHHLSSSISKQPPSQVSWEIREPAGRVCLGITQIWSALFHSLTTTAAYNRRNFKKEGCPV